MPAAGKGEVAEILKKKGFIVYGMGSMIRGLMAEQGVPVTPKSDKEFTIAIRKKYGKAVAAKLLMGKIGKTNTDKLVIEGIRSPFELDYIKKRMRVVIIAIVAPLRMRFARSKKRGRPDAPQTLQQFVKNKDKKEEKFGLLRVIARADYVIANTGTKADLRKNVDKVVKGL